MRQVFFFLLCPFGLHWYEIKKERFFWTRRNGTKKRVRSRFVRECANCGKEQELARPEKYHPTKFVWRTIHRSPTYFRDQ